MCISRMRLINNITVRTAHRAPLAPTALSADLGGAAAAEGGKRRAIQPAHLKQAILANPKLDFLKDLVASVPDPTAAAAGVREGEEQQR